MRSSLQGPLHSNTDNISESNCESLDAISEAIWLMMELNDQ